MISINHAQLKNGPYLSMFCFWQCANAVEFDLTFRTNGVQEWALFLEQIQCVE
jgi:hypothetical protein